MICSSNSKKSGIHRSTTESQIQCHLLLISSTLILTNATCRPEVCYLGRGKVVPCRAQQATSAINHHSVLLLMSQRVTSSASSSPFVAVIGHGQIFVRGPLYASNLALGRRNLAKPKSVPTLEVHRCSRTQLCVAKVRTSAG